jgi:hypothetical protein
MHHPTMTMDLCIFYSVIGFFIIALLFCMFAPCFKDHDALKPEKDAETLPKPKPPTVQTCKNSACKRLVSISKITGDYCTYCHINHAPAPESPKPKEVKKAIIKEVSND